MTEFEQIELRHRAQIESAVLRAGLRSCDLAFANIFGWQHVYASRVAQCEGAIVLKYRIDGTPRVAYMEPLGDGDWQCLVPQLLADAACEGQPLRLLLSEQGVELLATEEWAVDCNRDAWDYIYRREDLAQLPGGDFKSKRNHFARFVNRYNYRFEPLSAVHIEECLRVDAEWRERRGTNDAMESVALRRVLGHFEELGLLGGVLRVDERVVAFTFGSMLTADTFCTHFEKADTDYDGAYAAINRFMAESLPESVTYVNREEDLGVEGLRRAKLSYRPTMMFRKYAALKLDDRTRGIRALWCRVFGDEPRWVNRFLARFYDPRLSFTRSCDGRIVAMAHIVPLVTELGRTAYLYAVAVDELYRGRGFAREVISEALACAGQGWGGAFDAVCVIPATDELKSLYAKFGFADEQFEMSFGTNGDDSLGAEGFVGRHSTFDLGADSATDNRAMVLRLAE